MLKVLYLHDVSSPVVLVGMSVKYGGFLLLKGLYLHDVRRPVVLAGMCVR